MSNEQKAQAYLQELHLAADRQSLDGQRWHTVLRIRAPRSNAEERALNSWSSNFAESRGEALHIEFVPSE
jgi:hypothetical protein